MLNHSVEPAKLLICLMGRHRGEQLVAAAKAAGARGGTIALGVSIGNSRLLQALSLADIQQDVVYAILGGEKDAVVAAVRSAADAEPRKLSGLAVVADVPEFLFRAAEGDDRTPAEPARDTGGRKMESGYKLITAIVNSGFGDGIMAAARKAGATGGTILGAHGTGTEEDVQFFGITLVPEKEMLLIVADNTRVQPIIEALSAVPKLCEPGGGIVFTTNVEEFIVLGRQKTWSGDSSETTDA